jgi:hypothetical protein
MLFYYVAFKFCPHSLALPALGQENEKMGDKKTNAYASGKGFMVDNQQTHNHL